MQHLTQQTLQLYFLSWCQCCCLGGWAGVQPHGQEKMMQMDMMEWALVDVLDWLAVEM
jgi:hypothetical protein